MTESPLELELLREIGQAVRALRRLEKERDRLLARLERVRNSKKYPRKHRKGMDAAKPIV